MTGRMSGVYAQVPDCRPTVMTPELGVGAEVAAFQQKAGQVGLDVAGRPASPRLGRCWAEPLHRPPSLAASGYA